MREPLEPPKPGKAATETARPDRLAQALRANLARRKAQQRARASGGGDDPGAGDGAGPDDDNDKNEG